MLRWMHKSKGAISVFLCLILLPTYFLEGLVIDSARIYGAKTFVSEAGQLTMNAALSDYDEALNDAYGLIAMSDTAEELQANLVTYFKNTLDASGIDYETVNNVVHQLTGNSGTKHAPISFENISASDIQITNASETQIYQPQVMRQQILEYMKFRGPAMMAKYGVFDRITDGEFERLSKQKAASEAQLQFENKLDDLQADYEELKKELDAQSKTVNKYDRKTINETLADGRKLYQKSLAYYAIIYARCAKAKSYAEDLGDAVKPAMEQFVRNASKITEMDPGDDLGKAGDALVEMFDIYEYLKDHDGKVQEMANSDDDEDVRLYENYVEANKTREETFAEIPDKIDMITIAVSSEILPIEEESKVQMETYKQTLERLEALKEKYAELKDDYHAWGDKIAAIPDSKTGQDTTKADMEQYRTENYQVFEDSPDNIIDALYEKVKNNGEFYEKTYKIVSNLKFCGHKISEWTDYTTYTNAAGDYIAKTGVESRSVEFFFKQWTTSGEYEVPEGLDVITIDDDAFYLQVQQYCADDGTQQEEEGKQANADVGTIVDELWELFTTSDITSSMGDNVPTSWLSQQGISSGQEGTFSETNMDVSDKDNRKSLTDAFTSTDQADSEMAQLATIGGYLNAKSADVMENLYLTEYMLDMFSNYTSNKTYEAQGAGMKYVTIADPKSLSGVSLKDNQLYRAEAEYIIWGHKDAATNVRIAKSLMFAIQLTGNMISGLTNSELGLQCSEIALMFLGGYFTHKAIKAVLMIVCILAETTKDLDALCKGGKVLLYKNQAQWNVYPLEIVSDMADGELANPTSNSPAALSYRDYLWIFAILHILNDNNKYKMLARTGDLIEVNRIKKNQKSIQNMFTMIQMEATVTPRTTFMPKIPAYTGSSIEWKPFEIHYVGAMGE